MTARRGRGEGAIRQRPDGRWEARLDLGLAAGKRQRPSVYGRTKAEVIGKLRKAQREQDAGLPSASGEKLGPFCDWWLTTLEAKVSAGQKSPNTVDNARWAVECWIKPHLGHKRLRELQPEDVETLLAAMVTTGRARRSVTRVKSYLGQLLAVAERRGKVARNVARISEMPATKAPTPRRALTEDQAADLLKEAAGDPLEALLVTGLSLGLRPGELTGLRWSDVDLDAPTLTVAGSLKRERGQLRLGETKTAKSRRVLQLPERVATTLRAHRKAQKERQLAAPLWHDTDLVFTTPIGTPLDPSNLRGAFSALTEKAGLGHWTPNELRHSAASILSAAGIPLEIIADILGHASTRMLEQHYRHQLRPSIDAHVGVMDGLFGS